MDETTGKPMHQDAVTKKGSPPERPQDVQLRSIVVLSFWALILFVGVPMWWQTTSIHRAQLPLPEMLRWSDGQVQRASANQSATLTLLLEWPTYSSPADLDLGSQHALCRSS